MHTGSALCLFDSAAGDDDDEPPCLTTEADDEGVGVGNVSSCRAAQGN